MEGEDAGIAYEQALVKAGKQKGKGKLLLQPALVASLLDPDVAPSAEQRYGLEQLLHKQLQLREEHYRIFRKHWYQLQARDFRYMILRRLISCSGAFTLSMIVGTRSSPSVLCSRSYNSMP
jgi:hypothetical protein